MEASTASNPTIMQYQGCSPCKARSDPCYIKDCTVPKHCLTEREYQSLSRKFGKYASNPNVSDKCRAHANEMLAKLEENYRENKCDPSRLIEKRNRLLHEVRRLQQKECARSRRKSCRKACSPRRKSCRKACSPRRKACKTKRKSCKKPKKSGKSGKSKQRRSSCKPCALVY